MRFLKRFLLLFCWLWLLPLSGCQEKAPTLNPDSPTAVTIWHYYNGKQNEAFDSLVNLFNETIGVEKGIIVTAESKGNVNDLARAIQDSAAKKLGSDEMPNIFATYADNAYALQKQDILVNIRNYLTPEELEEYVADFIEEGEIIGDQLFVFPIAKSTELLYVNEAAWTPFANATGVQIAELATWEGLARVSEIYYEWSGGKPFFGRDAFPNYLIVGSKQLGHEIFKQGESSEECIQLDENTLYRLWQGYAEAYIKGYYNAYGRFRSDDVKTGDLVAFVGSTSSVSYFPKEVTNADGSTYPIYGLVLPLPNFEGTEAYSVQQGAGMSVYKSGGLEEVAAIEFLKWFTSIEQNIDFSVNSGYLPVKKAANQKEKMMTALDCAGIPSHSIQYQSALTALEAVTQVKLYTNKPFEGGMQAREILNDCITGKLLAYRERYQEMSSNDEDMEQQMMDDFFREWYQDLSKDLFGH